MVPLSMGVFFILERSWMTRKDVERKPLLPDRMVKVGADYWAQHSFNKYGHPCYYFSGPTIPRREEKTPSLSTLSVRLCGIEEQ